MKTLLGHGVVSRLQILRNLATSHGRSCDCVTRCRLTAELSPGDTFHVSSGSGFFSAIASRSSDPGEWTEKGKGHDRGSS